MKRQKPLLTVCAALGCAVVATWLVMNGRPAPPPETSPPIFLPVGARITSIESTHMDSFGANGIGFLWARRVGPETLVLVRTPESSRPKGAWRLEFLDEGGSVIGSGRMDSCGSFRGTVPGGATIIAGRNGVSLTVRTDLPEERNPAATCIPDRQEIRPGDAFRICLRGTGGPAPAPVLRFEPAEEGIPPAPFVPVATDAGVPPSARWMVFEARIPDDVRPGAAIVDCGGGTFRIPITGLSSPPDRGEGDGRGGSPDTPPAPPDPGTDGHPAPGGLHLEHRDGRWVATGPEDTEAVLFFADSGGRILAHQAVAATDGSASTPLPPGEDAPAKVRVTAVASTPRGFFEASVGNPGSSIRPMDDDPVLSRFLAEKPLPPAAPSGPAWIHEGDVPAGPGPAPPSRQGFLARDGSVSVVPGVETAAILPAGAEVRWAVHPAGASGALRIRGGGEILAETRIGPGKDGGVLRTAGPAPRSLLVESDAGGIASVSFEWTLDGKAGKAPPHPGRIVVLNRVLPERGRAGEEAEYRIVIRWKERSVATEVACPIPRGAVLAEDGWSIRERAPAGTRVGTPDGAVILRIPAQEPGEAVLSFRIRLAWPGRYAAPAALARSGSDPALSEAGFLVIE